MNDNKEHHSDHSASAHETDGAEAIEANTEPHVLEVTSREELLRDVGIRLKNKRQSKGITTEEVALSLKLRAPYLDALESGDWDNMPGEVYAIGFLKQYAGFLALDVAATVEKLKTGQYKLTKPLTYPDPPIAPNKTWVIVAALAFVVLLILFNLFDSDPNHTTPSPAEMSELVPAPDMEMDAEMSGELAPPSDLSPAEGADSDAPAADAAATAATVAPALKAPVKSVAPQSAAPLKPAVQHEYQLSAVGGDVWMQLSTEAAADEKPVIVKEVLLRDGESIAFQHPSPALLLTCGNAFALQASVDGKTVVTAGTLGAIGKVIRDYKLNANNP